MELDKRFGTEFKDDAVKKMEELIARIENNNPLPLPTLNPGSSGSTGTIGSTGSIKSPSDSLMSVGNFLGAGRNAVESQQRETNRILKQSLSIQEKMLDEMGDEGTIVIP